MSIKRVHVPTAEERERERDERWQAKGKTAIRREYNAFAHSANACEKQYWERYETASDFEAMKKEAHAPTAWDTAFGSSFDKRKMANAQKQSIWNLYWAYVATMPEPAMAMHQTNEAQGPEQKAVFNEMVRRDFECFQKLK